MSVETKAGWTRRRFMGAAGAAVSFGGTRAWAESSTVAAALEDFPDPAAGPGAGWGVVVFPDTQNYAKYAKNQANFEMMTRWVANHAKAWNLGLGLHVGDFVEQNRDGNGGDGWLRLLTLRPDGRTLDVRTFSPMRLADGRDPWRRGADHSFTIV